MPWHEPARYWRDLLQGKYEWSDIAGQIRERQGTGSEARMMHPEDQRVSEELKRRLLAAGVPVLEMRAFGSRARGDARPDSDLDLFLVLASRTREIERQIDRIAWEVGRDAGGLVIMTFECTQEEMQALPLRAAPLLEEIAREGVPV